MYPIQENSQTDDKLKEIIKGNPLVEPIDEESKEHERYEVFESIHKLVSAAHKLYCKGDMEWDKMLINLSDALMKLKGKEKDLYDIGEEDTNDDDNEG